MVSVPPVVDHVQRVKIQEAVQTSPFNIFNILAIVAIVVIGFYLYKKFTDKKPKFRFPVGPSPPVKTDAAPIKEETDEDDEVPDAEPSKED